MLHIIIFSHKRDCQLNLLYQSMGNFLNIKQYKKTLITQTGREFEAATKAAVNSEHEYTMFLPDDCMFTREVDFDFLEMAFISRPICFSLRCGINITYDLPLSKNIEKPFFTFNPYWTGMMAWPWKECKDNGYFGYPMSVDGHIFKTNEISEKVNAITFTNPNQLETALVRNPIDHDFMAAFDKPSIVNLVLNRVQTTHPHNKSGNFTTEYLQARYDAGHRLDLDKMIESVRNANSYHVIPERLYWKGGNE
jgi:hypothetical protein